MLVALFHAGSPKSALDIVPVGYLGECLARRDGGGPHPHHAGQQSYQAKTLISLKTTF